MAVRRRRKRKIRQPRQVKLKSAVDLLLQKDKLPKGMKTPRKATTS